MPNDLTFVTVDHAVSRLFNVEEITRSTELLEPARQWVKHHVEKGAIVIDARNLSLADLDDLEINEEN